MDFELSSVNTGSKACLEGELAFHADLSISEIIVEMIWPMDLSSLEQRFVIELLRLVYWQRFNNAALAWTDKAEQADFEYEIALRKAATSIQDEILSQVRVKAEIDAAKVWTFRAWK